MRTIPRSWIGLMSWFALQVSFQIVPYDSGVVGPYTIPRNEGLAMDAYNSQAKFGRTSSVLRAPTCYLEVREWVSPRIHFLQVDKCQYVKICHILVFDEFINFEPSPQSAIVVYHSNCQSMLLSISQAVDVHSHDEMIFCWVFWSLKTSKHAKSTLNACFK